LSREVATVDASKWSGEGELTQRVLDRLQQMAEIVAIRVEDAPASRSEAGYNFISNEIFVAFSLVARREPVPRWGWLGLRRTRYEPSMTLEGLTARLAEAAGIGEPDYADEGMLQYLRTERIIPPYQTRGYKLIELLRIYEVKA